MYLHILYPKLVAVATLPSLKSYLNVSIVFLMRDILIPTEVLNKILQSDSLLPHELNSKVADTNNNNKRPLTPKSMPPAGDEHAKLFCYNGLGASL